MLPLSLWRPKDSYQTKLYVSLTLRNTIVRGYVRNPPPAQVQDLCEVGRFEHFPCAVPDVEHHTAFRCSSTS